MTDGAHPLARSSMRFCLAGHRGREKACCVLLSPAVRGGAWTERRIFVENVHPPVNREYRVGDPDGFSERKTVFRSGIMFVYPLRRKPPAILHRIAGGFLLLPFAAFFASLCANGLRERGEGRCPLRCREKPGRTIRRCRHWSCGCSRVKTVCR